MFNKFKRQKKQKIMTNHQLPLEQVRELIQMQKLPIVILDPQWYEIKQIVSTPTLLENEVRLNEVLKERGKLNTDTLEYEKVKHQLFNNILVLSEKVQNQPGEKQMDELEKTRQMVLKTNEKIKESEEKLRELEILIQRLNEQIVEELVGLGYGQMKVYRTEKDRLDEEIEYLRKQVLIKTEERKKYDKEFGIVYNYLHNLTGFKYMDQVDKKVERF